ncbi:MAG: peroxiredoxin [candidate division Zixibacteria bacterium]|nr:peroxiredoxin [candidate division Zixibacteria bacterium]
MQIDERAPYFKGMAVMPDKTFKKVTLDDYRGKWLVLFFYPLDFSFVCPTEVRAFSLAFNKFKDVGADLLGCSVDSHFAHLAWIEKELGQIKFPLLSDVTKNISRSYNVLVHDAFSLRGTYIIDPDGVLKSIVVNDTSIGRSIDETLRTLKAIQTGELTGAGWQPGDETLGLDGSKHYDSGAD